MRQLLIVEDNEMNLDMLSRRLAARGFCVTAAGDGISGVEAARQSLPDLILMDLSLPEMDGWTATRLLKADPITRHIPVLALTAHAMDGDRERALSAGCDAFDTKPVDFARLLEIIDRLIRGRNSPHADHPGR